ncbi:MAG: DNA replication/repair protein RecF [Candidatus Obscuribacterales bacterium]|nr:DNA replication/repair protein RecF [Candidatus Obscuribacterales bacterium]
MKVTQLKLEDFRNYKNLVVDFADGKNIIIGDNAQGKSNLLEAIELCASGKSSRAEQDFDFIRWGSNACKLLLSFDASGAEETISIALAQQNEPNKLLSTRSGRLQKVIKVNGVKQTSVRGLLGRIPFVSFTSNDLGLLRAGPKFRREWIDGIAVRLKPSHHDVLSNYAKTVAQRNRLLKLFAERGRMNVSDQDELLVWDKQLTRFAIAVIKMRLKVLAELLPLAQEIQSHLSRADELLCIDYALRTGRTYSEDFREQEESDQGEEQALNSSFADLHSMPDLELAKILARLLKQLRGEELRRKQSLVGPHRDDLQVRLNGASAIAFASQGQQRSIVLALKMAELKQLSETTGQTPILLLDDVLAELDPARQALLLSAIGQPMQTIITTTHLSGFDPKWLEGARIMTVNNGQIVSKEETSAP